MKGLMPLFRPLVLTKLLFMVLNPNRWFSRNLTKFKHKIKRNWTKLAVTDGTIYRIENKMYQVYNGRYILIGKICHMCDSLEEIKATDLTI